MSKQLTINGKPQSRKATELLGVVLASPTSKEAKKAAKSLIAAGIVKALEKHPDANVQYEDGKKVITMTAQAANHAIMFAANVQLVWKVQRGRKPKQADDTASVELSL